MSEYGASSAGSFLEKATNYQLKLERLRLVMLEVSDELWSQTLTFA